MTDVPMVVLATSDLEMPIMLAWLISTAVVAGLAILRWRREERRVAVLCLVWALLSVAIGYRFLGPVPSEASPRAVFSAQVPTCFAGDASPSVAFADLPPEAGADPSTPACRTMARAYVAVSLGVIVVNLALLVLLALRLRHPAPQRK